MKIDARTAIADYKALRAGNTEIALSGTPAEILKAQTDNDPSTEDVLVASTWSGSFSDPGGQVTFKEQNQQLQLEVTSHATLTDEGSTATATIDLNTNSFTSHSDSEQIQFIIAEPQKPTIKPSPEQELRDHYAHVKGSLDDYEVQESRPGYLQVTSWDGGFSSPTVTETFEEKDGQLIYTKFTPGSPFLIGSKDETITRTCAI